MKRILPFISIFLLPFVMACTPEKDSPDPNLFIVTNDPPVVNVGGDIKDYPFPAIRINPSIVDAESNVFTLKWTKLSGPEDVKITPSSDNDVLLKELKNGNYEIELSVTDVGGAVVKDTLTLGVDLRAIDNGEVIFNNITWTNDEWWGATVVIPSFQLNVPPDKKFKVYIQRDFDQAWIEVIDYNNEPDYYGYSIEEYTDDIHQYKYGNLLIYDMKSYTPDTPNVKIVFMP